MKKMKNALWILMAGLLLAPVCRAEKPGFAEFQKMKYGFFVHYVWGGSAYQATINRDGSMPAGLNDLADRFNAEQFAADLAAMRVEYVVFTAFHANMNTLFPSKVMEKWLPGHCSKRDLLGDMIKACKAKNIPVLFYTHPRDGHDCTPAEQARTGWVAGQSPNPDFNRWDKTKWNNFINEFYGELADRYGNDILGLYLDEGSAAADSDRVVDYPRLCKTVTANHPQLLLMQNDYGNLYACHIGNSEVFYNGSHGTPDGDQWQSAKKPISIVVGSIFWAAFAEGKNEPAQKSDKVGYNRWIQYTPEAMFRYTVLQAGACTDGGGVLWAAGTYPGGGWETGVLDRMKSTGSLVQAVAPAIKNTYPSTSYPTRPGTRIADLQWGVATRSPDDLREYLHVLKAPAGSSVLNLPPPADGKKFASAKLLKSGKPVRFTQSAAGLRIELPVGESWDPLDTVIALEVTADSPSVNMALWKPFRVSSLAGKHYGMLATDGDSGTAWVPSSGDQAPTGFVDLAQPRRFGKIEVVGSLPAGSRLEAAEDFGFTKAKSLATSGAVQGGRLEIVRATYGAGNTTADVTESVRAAVVGGELKVLADNSLAGRDPAPGVKKSLVVEYALNGTRNTGRADEGETLSLGKAAEWIVELPAPVTARFLRLRMPRTGSMAVAEIKVWSARK
jgi:hypothetical protein